MIYPKVGSWAAVIACGRIRIDALLNFKNFQLSPKVPQNPVDNGGKRMRKRNKRMFVGQVFGIFGSEDQQDFWIFLKQTRLGIKCFDKRRIRRKARLQAILRAILDSAPYKPPDVCKTNAYRRFLSFLLKKRSAAYSLSPSPRLHCNQRQRKCCWKSREGIRQ